jgi:UDP-N-acetyl-D-mannosaminuronic acid dehydrogenase
MHSREVAVLGLGYVGLTLAVHIAAKGRSVFGIDRSPAVLQALAHGSAHFFEEDFDPKLKAVIESGAFRFGRRIEKSENPRVYIISVGTPIGEDGSVNLAPLQRACEDIGEVMRRGDAVLLRSTVKVGTTVGMVRQTLNKYCDEYHLAFCPERTIEGKAMLELQTLPQVIGPVKPESAPVFEEFFSSLCDETIVLDSAQEAELTKLVNNAERDVMFAFANEVAMLCEAKGLDVNNVLHAVNHHYPRSNVRRPGLVGGPCLSKDPYILSEGFDGATAYPNIIMASRRVNERMVGLHVPEVLALLPREPKKVSILGLAFKGAPPTSDTRGSLAIPLLRTLRERLPEAAVFAYDSLVRRAEFEGLGLNRATTLEEAFEDADLVLVQNNHPDFKRMDVTYLMGLLASGGIVYDFWNLHPRSTYEDNRRYLALGNTRCEVEVS